MNEIAVELKHVTKKFGNVVANNNIDLIVKRGTIHGLLGENGSGKSTLMKVLFGLHKKNSGEIFVDGKKANFNSPLDAINSGIGMIQQEFMLLPGLTVRENLMAGIWSKNPKTKRKDLLKDSENILEKFGLQDSLDVPVHELSVGEQQKVEIAKTLFQKAEIIILDEPTSMLTPQEGLELFEILNSLKDEGKTIIFITHKLDEVLKYCKEVTVLRAGEKVASFSTSDVDRYSLAEKMVGKKVLFNLNAKKEIKKKERIVLENICYTNKQHFEKLKNISLSINQGEILGIAGIDGNGQKELADILAGITKPSSGTYILDGEKVEVFNPKKLSKRGVSFVPEERNNLGAVNNLSIDNNLILKKYDSDNLSKYGFIKRKAVEKYGKKLIEEYEIKAENGKVNAGTLSGGNLQKVILARELSNNPKLLICSQPTRGLDVGAVENIQNMLIDARNKGISIVLISTELDEILSLSDRVAVIFEGKIVDVIKNDEKIDIGLVGLMMAGGKDGNKYVVGGAAI
jgi:simple sugar transport system ATP-binding protein